jgi:short-subunit dehydrogenase
MNIFITGGTTGIGLALAKLYLNEGHNVGICGRNKNKIEDNIFTQYPKLKFYPVDVCYEEELDHAIKDFAQGSLDILIANAGVSPDNASNNPDFLSMKKVIDINLYGVINSFKSATEIMIPQNSGHIVAIASVAGLVGLTGSAAYCCSKASVINLCESLAIDLKDFGIDCTTIAPGFIDTPLTRKNKFPMPLLMSVDKGAELIKRAISKRKVIYIFPWPIKIGITLLKIIPRFLYVKLMRLKCFKVHNNC